MTTPAILTSTIDKKSPSNSSRLLCAQYYPKISLGGMEFIVGYSEIFKMSSKLLVIIATGDREKALTALMYVKNTIKYGWLEEVKILFFGPSENLLVSDTDVTNSATELAGLGQPIACKFLSDRDGISKRIEGLGIAVDYVGSMIADLISEGYTPMVW
jgi:hypothetical protein